MHMMHKVTRQGISVSALFLGLVLSALMWQSSVHHQSPLFAGILPGLPLLILGVLGLCYNGDHAAVKLLGAIIATLLLTLLSYGTLFVQHVNSSSASTTPNVAVLLSPLVFYYPIGMFIGWTLGEKYSRNVLIK